MEFKIHSQLNINKTICHFQKRIYFKSLSNFHGASLLSFDLPIFQIKIFSKVNTVKF